MNRTVYEISKAAIKVTLRVLFFARWGGARLPARGPVVIVANHCSVLDPLLLGSACPRPVHFLARGSLARRPLARWWLRAVGTVLVDRTAPTATTLGALIDSVRAGGVVLVFPEGTRSRTGAVGEFKRGLLLILRRTGAPVVPGGVAGSFRAFPPNAKFPRMFQRCRVTFGEPIAAAEVLADGGLQRLRARIVELVELAGAEDREGVPVRSSE